MSTRKLFSDLTKHLDKDLISSRMKKLYNKAMLSDSYLIDEAKDIIYKAYAGDIEDGYLRHACWVSDHLRRLVLHQDDADKWQLYVGLNNAITFMYIR